MSLFDEDITRAIKHKLAPDFMTALQQAKPMAIMRPMRTLTIPLRADVAVIYDAGMAGFSVRGKCEVKKSSEETDGKPLWLQSESIFSSRDIACGRDAANLMEHLFENMKREFIRSLVNGEIERIFKVKP